MGYEREIYLYRYLWKKIFYIFTIIIENNALDRILWMIFCVNSISMIYLYLWKNG